MTISILKELFIFLKVMMMIFAKFILSLNEQHLLILISPTLSSLFLVYSLLFKNINLIKFNFLIKLFGLIYLFKLDYIEISYKSY